MISWIYSVWCAVIWFALLAIYYELNQIRKNMEKYQTCSDTPTEET